MKIKYKLSATLSIILIILGIVLNMSIRYVLNINMEKSVSKLLDEVLNSTREAIKYRVSIDTTLSKEELLKQEAEYINNYISLNYDCKVNIRGINGDIYCKGIENYNKVLEENIDYVKSGKCIADLMYTKNGLDAILSYPIYVNERSIGIIEIIKNYDDIYEEYEDMINLITVIEIIIFILVLIVLIIMTGAITKPITILTEAIINFGNGNYNSNIPIQKGKDEVAILSNEFVSMQDKINEQILTIKIEKEKVETLAIGRKSFFDNVTHEIKTPLTAIVGYAEMVKDNIVDDEKFKKKAIERIYYESQRLNLLVLSLINVSMGLSAINEEKISFDIGRLIEEVCDDMKIKCDKYHLKIIKNIENSTFRGQNNKIRELLINIIDNAIKYSINNQDIVVTGKSIGGIYNIKVVNKAEPIPEEVYNNIYEPLVKCKSSDDEYSSGLGLYLCKEIVDEHNGEIDIINGNEVKVKVKLPQQ